MNKKKICITVMLLLFSINLMTACSNKNDLTDKSEAGTSTNSNEEGNEKDVSSRSYHTNILKEVKKEYSKEPNDKKLALKYAQTLFSLGNFEEARSILLPLLNETKVNAEALYLSAQINYLEGNYQEAENQYKELVTNHYETHGVQAEYGLQLIYYRTNNYSKAENLFNGENSQKDPVLDLMRSYGDTQPNQVDWNEADETVIPFVAKDPLPVIPIEVNGVKMNAFIDTAADGLLIDSEKAKELGIETVSKLDGLFAGGKSQEVGYAKTDTLKLGDVSINNVSTMTGPIDGTISSLFPNVKDVHAAIGTNVLQNFVPTIDFISKELKLVPKNEVGRNKVQENLNNDDIKTKVPFTIGSSHYMFTRGSINEYENLNMFMDSGMPANNGKGPILSPQAMKYMGFPIPKNKDMEKSTFSGMGGGSFKTSTFDLNSYNVGSLGEKNTSGQYWTGDQFNMYETTGFVSDAMIGHDFVSKYRWTIDFDNYSMTFSKPKGE